MLKKFFIYLSTAIFLTFILMISSCSKQPTSTSTPNDKNDSDISPNISSQSPADTTAKLPDQPTKLVILDGKSSDFKIIRSDDSIEAITKSVANMLRSLSDSTDGIFSLTTDWIRNSNENVKIDDAEILIGQTNRVETAEVLAALPENSYTVTIKNNKLIIVGTDDNLTVLALYDFEQRILNNPELCSKGKLIIGEENCFTVTRDEKFSLPDMIQGNYNFLSTSKKIINCYGIDGYKIGQGAASDGTYAYFALRNSDDTGAVICKYRLDDGSFVANSEVLDLGHANDMTFDTVKKQLVVAHGQSEGKILTIVDPETLKFVKDINITHGAGAITYSVERNCYAISQGGSTLHMMTNELQHVTSYSRITGTGYTAQGMGSDEDYIYFPMSGSKDNILQVYDWNGNYATTITIPIDMESESLYWVNDNYYIAFNHKGSEILHRLDFCIVYDAKAEQ